MDLLSAPPKSQQVAEVLRRQIQSGALAPGQRVSSVRSLAKQFRVSEAVIRTAYRILETEDLVRTEPSRGTFVQPPDTRKATGLLFGLITTYGLFDIHGYFEAASRIHSTHRSMYVPIHASSDHSENTASIMDAVQMLNERNPVGYYLDVEAQKCSFAPEELRQRFGYPVCVVHRWEWETDPSGPAVLVDHLGGLCTALRYLLDKGHERILLFGHYSTPRPFLRTQLEQAYAAMGYSFPCAEMPYLSAEDLQEDPGPLFQLLKGDAPPTAMVAANDYLAMRLRRQFGTQLPRLYELEIVGKYDAPWSDMPGQEFHTLCIDFDELWRHVLARMMTPNSLQEDVDCVQMSLKERTKSPGGNR